METELADARERQLVESATRQPEAFHELYLHYFPRVFAYVASHTSRLSDAEDLVSVIFLRVIEGIGHFEYRDTGAFAAWLFRIAHNTVLDFHRRRHQQGPSVLFESMADHATEEESLVDVMLREETAALLRASIAQLSPRRREVIVLRFFGGLRNREIAAILQLDERSVAAHVSRGLDDIACALRDQGILTRLRQPPARLARVDERRRPGAAGNNRNDVSRFVQRPVDGPRDKSGADRTRPWIDLVSGGDDLTKHRHHFVDALAELSTDAGEGSGVLSLADVANHFAILAWPTRRVFRESLEAQLIERLHGRPERSSD